MVVMLKPEAKTAIPEIISEPVVVPCERDSRFDVQNVIDNIIVVERVKRETPRDILEKIAQAFAMIFCILSAFTSFACVTYMAKRVYHVVNYFSYPEVDFQDRLFISILLLLLTYSSVSYICSIYLLKGLNKRKSTLLLIYLVYGIINITFASVLLVAINTVAESKMFVSMKKGNETLWFTLVYLTCVTVYAVFLFAVYTIYEDYVQRELKQAESKRMEPFTLPLRFSRPAKTVTA